MPCGHYRIWVDSITRSVSLDFLEIYISKLSARINAVKRLSSERIYYFNISFSSRRFSQCSKLILPETLTRSFPFSWFTLVHKFIETSTRFVRWHSIFFDLVKQNSVFSFCCGIQICNEVDWKVLDHVIRDSLVLSFQPKRVLIQYEKDYLTQKDLFNRRLSGMREITQSTQVFDNTIKDSFVSPFLTEARVNAVSSKLLNKSLPISLISRFFCFLPGVLTSNIYARWVKQTDQIVQKKVAWQMSGNCILTMII